jgi:hypothetical protein
LGAVAAAVGAVADDEVAVGVGLLGGSAAGRGVAGARRVGQVGITRIV